MGKCTVTIKGKEHDYDEFRAYLFKGGLEELLPDFFAGKQKGIPPPPTKLEIPKKPLTKIEPEGEKEYHKIEFPKKTAPTAPVKEVSTKQNVWDFTRQEWDALSNAERDRIHGTYKSNEANPSNSNYHVIRVLTALNQGKDIPRKVLNGIANPNYHARRILEDVADGKQFPVITIDWAKDNVSKDEQSRIANVANKKAQAWQRDITNASETELQKIANSQILNETVRAQARDELALRAKKKLSSKSPTKPSTKENVKVGDTVYNALTGKQGVIYEEDGNLRVKQGKNDAGFYSKHTWLQDEPMESALDTLKTDRGIDYEKFKDVTRRVEQGELAIDRLDRQGERGRIAGGQRALEASVLLGTNERSNQKASQRSGSNVESRGDTRARQERLLENYAKEEGIWFDWGQHFGKHRAIGRGGEAFVYRQGDNAVVKAIDYHHINRGLTPQQFIDDRIALYNHIFPETPYKLLGFTRDHGGKFRFLVEQPFINVHGASRADVDALMKSKGFEPRGKETYTNGLYIVHDIHEKNAAKDANGNVYVIDAVPKFVDTANYRDFDVTSDEPMEQAVDPETQTTNFKKWFRDSKVVDENGNPLRVIHGSNNPSITSFNTKEGGKRKSNQQLDFGTHFSADADYTATYSGPIQKNKAPTSYPAYLSLQNPLDLTDASSFIAYKGDKHFEALSQLAKAIGMKPNANNYYTQDGVKKTEIQNVFVNQHFLDAVAPAKAHRALLDAGYDGVIYEPYNRVGLHHLNRHPKSYIALKPSQIKSAIGNNGNYDINADDPMEQAAWQGSPHRFNKEVLVKDPNGKEVYLEGTPDEMPKIPDGYEVIREYPNGRHRDDKIGSGEGAQAYGYGHYFADSESVAEYYRTTLSKGGKQIVDKDNNPVTLNLNSPAGSALVYLLDNNKNAEDAVENWKRDIEKAGGDVNSEYSRAVIGAIRNFQDKGYKYSQAGAKYRVDLKPENDEYLLWDKPLSEQSEKVRDILLKARKDLGTSFHDGQSAYKDLVNTDQMGRLPEPFQSKPNSGLVGSQKAASEYLKSLGIRGIKYLDGSSRGKGEGNYNYVIFDPADVDIEEVMQRSREEIDANKTSFDNAKKLPIDKLLDLSNPRDLVHEDGIIDMSDVPETELIRRVMGNAFPDRTFSFYGLFNDANNTKKIIATAKDLADQADEAGYDGQKFRDLAKIIEDASKANGTVIFYIDEDALPHEKTHRALYQNRTTAFRSEQIPEAILKKLHSSDIVQKALKGVFGKNYPEKLGQAVQMEEFVTPAVLGQWGDLGLESEADQLEAMKVAREFLDAYAEHNATEEISKDQLLRKLASEIQYAKEFSEIQRTRQEGEKGEGADIQSPEDSNKQATEGETNRTASPEREQSETVKEPQVKERKTVKTAHEYGILNKNNTSGETRYYTVKAQDPIERAAQDYIEKVGFSNAFAQAITTSTKPNDIDHLARQMALMQILNQQAMSALNVGNTDLFDYYEAQTQAIMRAMAPEFTEAGQFISYAQRWKITNPATVLARVKLTRVQNGLSPDIPADQQEKIVAAATKLQEAQAVIDAQEARIRELEEGKQSYTHKGKKTRPLTKTEATVLESLSKRSSDALQRLRKQKDAPMEMAMGESPIAQQTIDDLTAVGAEILLKGWKGQPITVEQFKKTLTDEIGHGDFEFMYDKVHAESVLKMDAELRNQKQKDAIARVKGEVDENGHTPNVNKSDDEILEIIANRKAESKTKTEIRAEHRKLAKAFKTNEQFVEKAADLLTMKDDIVNNVSTHDAIIAGVLARKAGATSIDQIMKVLREKYPDRFAPERTDSVTVRKEKQRDVTHITAESEKLYKATTRALAEERQYQRDTAKGITPEDRKLLETAKSDRRTAMNDLTELVKANEHPPQSFLHNVGQVNRAIKVALVQTAFTNLISTKIEQMIANAPMDTMDILLQRAFKGLRNEGLSGSASLATAWWTPRAKETVYDEAMGEYAKGLSKHEILLKVIDEHPEFFAKFFGDFSPDFHSGVSSVLDKFMIPMRIQEFLMRDAEGVKALAQRAAMKGLDYKEIVKSGDYSSFTKEDLTYALERALGLTYALRPKRGEGVTDAVFATAVSALRTSGLLDLIGSEAAPFLNFMYNTINKYKTKMPIMAQGRLIAKTISEALRLKAAGEEPHYYREAIKNKWTSRQIANQMWGVIAMGAAIAIARAVGDADDWYRLKIPFTNGMGRDGGYYYLDVRTQPLLAPFFFVANKINRIVNGKDPFTRDDWEMELMEAFTGMSYRQAIEQNNLWLAAKYGTKAAWTAARQQEDTDRNLEKFWVFASKWFGNEIGTATNLLQFKTIKDIVAQLDEQERRPLNLEKHPLLQGIDTRMPESRRIIQDVIKRQIEPKKDYATGIEEVRNDYPILKIFGFNLTDEADIRKEPSQAEILAAKARYEGSNYNPPELPDEKIKAAIKRDFRRAGEKLQKGTPEAMALQKKLDEYNDILAKGEKDYAKRQLFTTDLEDNFKALEFRKAWAVWKAATPKEQEKLKTLFVDKLNNAIDSDKSKDQKDLARRIRNQIQGIQ